MPDVLLLHPQQRTIFVEVKADDGRPSPVRLYRHEELRRLGFDVRVVDPSDWLLNKAEWLCSAPESAMTPSV